MNWSDIPFNPWFQKLDPRMLEDKFSVEKEIAKGHIGLVKVKYGKDFVVQFIAQMVLKPLMLGSAHEWQKLSAEAWRAYKNGEKQDSKQTVLVSSANGETQPNEAG